MFKYEKKKNKSLCYQDIEFSLFCSSHKQQIGPDLFVSVVKVELTSVEGISPTTGQEVFLL